MSEQKKDTLSVVGKSASTNTTTNTITQPQDKKQVFADGGLSKSKKKSNGNRKCLALDAKVNTVAIKVYDEQLPHGWNATCDAIRATPFIDFQVIGICHNRDLIVKQGDFWEASAEKPHYHIIVRCVDSKKRIRVRTILSGLLIAFRKGLDEELYTNHGVETVGKFSAYATYLTHETDDAIKDGKELYYRNELVSNLTVDEIMQIRDGYIRLTDMSKKFTDADWEDLGEVAFKLGYDLKGFGTWRKSLPMKVWGHAKFKNVRQRYYDGIEAKEFERPTITRLCIFVRGDGNVGKTYASERALVGKKMLIADANGTGQFDNLTTEHDGIIINDGFCPMVLNMTDNYIAHPHRRNSDNPAFVGDYFIVTSNKTFDRWVETCGIDSRGENYQPMISRFYICEILTDDDGVNYLALKSASTRGTNDDKRKRLDMFLDFQKKFNEIISEYKPQENTVDFDAYIDDKFKKPKQDESEQTLDEFNVHKEWEKQYVDDYAYAKKQMIIYNEQDQERQALALLERRRKLGLPDDWMTNQNTNKGE